MNGALQLLSNYFSQNSLINWLLFLGKMMPESLIDHCLISVSCFFGKLSKFLRNIIVGVKGYSGFSYCFKIQLESSPL